MKRYPLSLRSRADSSDTDLIALSRWFTVLILQLTIFSYDFGLDPKKAIDQYGHTVWLRQNGLPANTIASSIRTSDGYLWLGTPAGLYRFDGVEFHYVDINPYGSKDRTTVTSLYQTRDGRLWAGTSFSGLRVIVGDSVITYGRKEGFFDTQVWSLLEDRNGHLLIGTSYGLYMLYRSRFSTVLSGNDYISSMCKDSAGQIWVGTHDGVRVFPEEALEGTGSLKAVKVLRKKDGLPNDAITCLYTDMEGRVWIGTFGDMAVWENNKLTTIGVADGLPDYQINAIVEDRDLNLWVGTRNGISRRSEGKWTNFTKADGLTDNNVTSFAEGNEGCVWVGTSDGLNQFRDVSLTVYTTKQGLASNSLSSVAETPDGSMYFLSDQGSSVTRRKNGVSSVYNMPVGPAYVSRDGSFWIAQTGTLHRFKDGVLKTYGHESGILPKWISAITEDSQSLILYADHTGIFRFDGSKIQPYDLQGVDQYPADEYVSCFHWQNKDVLWIGSADSLMRIQNGKITSYTTADGLGGNWVSSMCNDGRGNMWIGSPQGGLTRYRDGKFTAYTTRVGLFTNTIFCVLTDNDGGLWMSSPRGIGYLSIKDLDEFDAGYAKTLRTSVYGIADGLKRDECFGGWQPGGWKTASGELWFATRQGAVLINPKAFQGNALAPPVYIQNVVADQMELKFPRDQILNAGTERIEFHYTALSYLIPERVQFRYKLTGFDRDFIDAGTRRQAFYTNLPPGQYEFRVIACNNDGVWNQTGAGVSFEILPHFYQRYWFLALSLLIVVAFVYGLVRLRLWQLLKRKKELEIHVQEALANIKMLGGLIPICSSCKKIRNDKGYWDQLEAYIQTHSEAKFSHGICPDCAKKLYPEIFHTNPENTSESQ